MSMQNILSIVIMVIGLYMIIAFNNGNVLSPPVLSGVAFLLLGLRPFLKIAGAN